MADEQKSGAAGQFVSKHVEKVVLAAAFLALLIYLALGVMMAEADPKIGQLKNQIAAINNEKEKDHSDDPEMKAGEARVFSEALAPHRTLTLAADTHENVATLVTVLKGIPTAEPTRRTNPVKVPMISFMGSSVELDKVLVNWAREEWSVTELVQIKKEYDILELTHYTIERKVGADGEWKVVGENVPLDQTTYEDTDIDPKTLYSYRITSFCEEDLKKRAGAKGMVIETPMPLKTMGIWNLTVNTAMKGQAYLTIEKFDKKLGRKVEKKHIHHAEEKIGWWGPKDGDPPVSVHLVPVGRGRSELVDFNTGMTLVSVKKKPASIQIDKCKAIFGAGGQRTGCTQSKLTVTISNTFEIVYVDDEGKHVILYPDPSNNPRAVSQACADHGGPDPRRKTPEAGATARTKEGGTGGNLPANLIEKQARETAAIRIFDRAQKYALTNVRRAVKDYQMLLDDFMDTDFVSKQKKLVIEMRIKSLSDQ